MFCQARFCQAKLGLPRAIFSADFKLGRIKAQFQMHHLKNDFWFPKLETDLLNKKPVNFRNRKLIPYFGVSYFLNMKHTTYLGNS